MAAIFSPPCFSQNMFVLGGEYNFTNPQFWGVGLGFNMKLFNEYVQNDLTINFGSISANDPTQNMWALETETAAEQKFLFYVKDNIYFSLDWKWVGLRSGVFASLGIYDIPDKTTADLFFNGGGFVGICVMPRSLISLTVDVSPGYAMAFFVREKEAGLKAGDFSLPLAVGIRFNLDKL